MRIKVLISFICIFFIGGGFIGCNNSLVLEQYNTLISDKKVLRFGLWGTRQEIEVYKNIIDLYNQSSSKYLIEIKQYPDEITFLNKLPIETSLKTKPDIVKIPSISLNQYLKNKLLNPIENSEKILTQLNNFNKLALDIWTVDGKLYGIPISIYPDMIIINKEMWKEANLDKYPSTLEEIKYTARKLTENGVYGLCINNNVLHFEELKSLNLCKSSLNKKFIVMPCDIGFSWDGEAFANKKVAMTIGGYWYCGFLKEVAPYIKYDIIPLSLNKNKSESLNSEALVILSDSSNKVAALEAIKYITCEESQENLIYEIGLIPSINSLQDEFIKSYKYIERFDNFINKYKISK